MQQHRRQCDSICSCFYPVRTLRAARQDQSGRSAPVDRQISLRLRKTSSVDADVTSTRTTMTRKAKGDCSNLIPVNPVEKNATIKAAEYHRRDDRERFD